MVLCHNRAGRPRCSPDLPAAGGRGTPAIRPTAADGQGDRRRGSAPRSRGAPLGNGRARGPDHGRTSSRGGYQPDRAVSAVEQRDAAVEQRDVDWRLAKRASTCELSESRPHDHHALSTHDRLIRTVEFRRRLTTATQGRSRVRRWIARSSCAGASLSCRRSFAPAPRGRPFRRSSQPEVAIENEPGGQRHAETRAGPICADRTGRRIRSDRTGHRLPTPLPANQPPPAAFAAELRHSCSPLFG